MSSAEDLFQNVQAQSGQNMGNLESRRQQWAAILDRAGAYQSQKTGIPKERQDREFWEKVLDVVQTGNYASAGLALAIKRGDPDVWQSIIQGIKDRTTYSEVLKESGITGGLGIGLGLIGDIFLDPTTYIPGFGLTAKGKAIEKVVGHLGYLRTIGEVTDRPSELAAIGKMIEGLPTGKERRILEAAVDDGAKAFYVRTFPEQVAQGLRRPFVIEKPVGLFHLPFRFPGTNLKVPLPIPKFETTGAALPLPKTIEVGMAQGVSSLGTLVANTPGIKQLKKFMGDKFFGSFVRPEFSNPTVMGMFEQLLKARDRLISGRTSRMHEVLDAIGRTERPTAELLKGIAVQPDSELGDLFKHIFKEAYSKHYGDKERRLLGIMIEEPERLLGRADQNVADMIFHDIFVAEPTDRYFRAMTRGAPADVANILDKTTDVPGLRAAEEKLQRGVIYTERALIPYRQGLRDLSEPDYPLLQKQLGDMEAGLETVRQRLAQLVEPAPIPEKIGQILPDMPTPKGPKVSAGVTTQFYGPAPAAEAFREAQVGKFRDLLQRSDAVLQYGSQPGRSAGLIQNARYVHRNLIEEMNKTRAEIDAVDMDLLRSERRFQEEKRLGKESEQAVQREIQDLGKQPSMRQPAVQVIPEARNELADLDRQLQIAEQTGDQARAGELLDKIQTLNSESVAARASRLAQEGNLSPLEHRAMALEMAHAARIQSYRQFQAQAGPEVSLIRAMGPPPIVQATEHTARVLGMDIREAQRLAATTSPLQFQQRVQGAIEGLAPQEVNQIGTEVVESVKNTDLGEVHRLLRESAGLAPASVQMQLADLGLAEPKVIAQIHTSTDQMLNRLRNIDPTSPIEVSSVHVIGDWARGEGEVGKPIQALAFVQSPLDEGDLAMALSQPVDLSGSLIPQSVEIMPYKLLPGQTKEEVLRAYGWTPPEPEIQASLALTTEQPGPITAAALAAKQTATKPVQVSLSEKPLLDIGRAADRVIEQARVLRTRKASLGGTDRVLLEKMRTRIAQVRQSLDSWEKSLGSMATGYERSMQEAIRYRLNRYDPEMLTAEQKSQRQALKEYRPRVFRGLGIKVPAPWKGGNPSVNPAVWTEEAKAFATLDRTNAYSILEANPSARPTGWREYAPNGAPTGKILTDKEFMAAFKDLNAGKARTIHLGPEKITLDAAFEQAKFFPETHTVEIVDPGGHIYQGQLNLPLDPEKFPKNVGLASGPVTLHLADLEGQPGKIDFANMEKARQWFLEKQGDAAPVKARFSEDAADPAKQAKITADLNRYLEEFFKVSRHGSNRIHPLRAGDLGLDFGPGGFYPSVVGTYKPWGQFRTGEFVSIDGPEGPIAGQVISEPSQNIRRVQTTNGQVLDVHPMDLKLGTLRQIARNDQSILDFLLSASQRADGSVDATVAKDLLKGLERDHLLTSDLADNLTDDLIRDQPMTPDLLMAKRALKAMLEGALQDEHSVGLLTRRLLFYLPRRALDKVAEKKIRHFGSLPQIVMDQQWFMRHRDTVQHAISQMNGALLAQGVEPRWLDDAMVATGLRLRASIKATETTKFIQNVLTQFGKRIDHAGVEAMAGGYTALLRDVYGLPKERISRIEELVHQLVGFEGTGKTAATEIGMDVRSMLTPEQQAARLGEIQKIRSELNEIAPPFGIYVPKGAMQHLTQGLASHTMEDLDALGLTEESAKAMSLLVENGAMYEGSQFLEIPIDKVFAVRHLPKDVPAYILPREVADAMNGALSNFASMGEDLHAVLRTLDIIQNYWKSWTLGIFPAYHFRNFVGNVWNAFLAGAHDPERWEEGGRFFSGNLNDFHDANGNLIPYDKLEQWIIEGNILNRGEFSVDLAFSPEGKFTRDVSLKPIPLKGMIDALMGKVPKQQVLLAIGQRIGKRNEDWAKVSLFLDGIYKGMSPTAAAERVHKYLFDYDALGTVERQVMPRLFPFYRWSRFNVPLQLQSFFTRPAKFTGVKKGIDAIKEYVGEPPEERYLPKWMKGQIPIPVKEIGPGKYGYWVLGNWLPAADLVRIMDPAAMSGGMLTPLVKAPFEYAANWSLFFQNHVERFPKETGQFLGLELRQRDINLLRNVRLLNEWDKLIFKKDLPLGLRIPRSVLGRVYPVDFTEQAQFRAYELGQQESALTTAIRRSQKELFEARQAGRSLQEWQVKHHIAALQQDLRDLNVEQERLRVSLPKKTTAEKRRERIQRKIIELQAGVK